MSKTVGIKPIGQWLYDGNRGGWQRFGNRLDPTSRAYQAYRIMNGTGYNGPATPLYWLGIADITDWSWAQAYQGLMPNGHWGDLYYQDDEANNHLHSFLPSRIKNGSLDTYLGYIASDLAAYGYDIIFRPWGELTTTSIFPAVIGIPWSAVVIDNRNGLNYTDPATVDPWQPPWPGDWLSNPSDHIDAWRHMHDLFESYGADNVKWLWSVSGPSHEYQNPSNQYRGHVTYKSCWPGKDYVDYVGVEWYPTNGQAVSPSPDPCLSDWTLCQYRELMECCENVPMICNEGGVGHTAPPNQKITFIQSLNPAHWHKYFPRIEAVILWDSPDHGNDLGLCYEMTTWPDTLTANNDCLNAAKAALGSSYYKSGV